MASKFDMQIDIDLEAGDISSAIGQVENEIDSIIDKQQEFNDAAEKSQDAASGMKKKLKEWKDGIAANVKSMMSFKTAAIASVGAIAGASVAVAGLSKAFTSVQTQVDAYARADIFGATKKDAEALLVNLKDVKTATEALNLATELKQGGFKSVDVKSFGEAVNAISALTGQTKQAVEDMLKSGELSEQALSVIGKTKEEAQAVIAKAEAAAGGRTLDALEKSRVLLQAFGKDISKVNGSLGNLGRANPFDVLLKQIQSIKEKLIKDLSPSINKIVKLFDENKDTLEGFFKGALKIATTFVEYLIQFPSSLKEVFQDIKQNLKGFFSFLDGAFKKAQTTFKFFKEGFQDFAKAIGFGPSKEQIRRLIAFREFQEEQLAKKLKEQAIKKEKEKVKEVGKIMKKGVITNAQRMRAQASIEASEELKGRKAEARALVRNFADVSLEAAAALGGPVSGALSAFKDSFEKFKVLSSEYGGAIRKFGKASESELQRLEKIGKITEEQGKAIRVFQTFAKAGEVDLKEYITNEKIVNQQLKVQNELLSSQQKLAAVQVELFNAEKDIRGALVGIDRGILSIRLKIRNEEERVRKARAKGQKVTIKDLQVERDKIKVLQNARKEYIKIAAERRTQLEFTRQLALLEQKAELSAKLREQKNAITDSIDATKSLELQLLQLQSVAGSSASNEIQSAQAINRIQRERVELLEQISLKTKQAALPNQSGLNVQLLNSEILSLQARNAELVKQESIQNRLIELQRRQATVGGSALAQLASQAVDASRQIGSTIASSVGTMSSAISDSFSALVEGAVKADQNLGAQFGSAMLGALGSLALEFAGVFAGIAAGKFALGDIAGGAALSLAAAGLAAIGGSLKGAASLAAPSAPATPSAPSASGARSSTSSSSRQSFSVQSQEPVQVSREVTVVMPNEMFGDPIQQVRRLERFARKGDRLAGMRKTTKRVPV